MDTESRLSPRSSFAAHDRCASANESPTREAGDICPFEVVSLTDTLQLAALRARTGKLHAKKTVILKTIKLNQPRGP
jgi:hypothetical protein